MNYQVAFSKATQAVQALEACVRNCSTAAHVENNARGGDYEAENQAILNAARAKLALEQALSASAPEVSSLRWHLANPSADDLRLVSQDALDMRARQCDPLFRRYDTAVATASRLDVTAA